MRIDILIPLGESGTLSLALYHDGTATVALEAEGNGGREAARHPITAAQMRAAAKEFGRLALHAESRAPRPAGCALDNGAAVHRCRAAGACPCAIDLSGAM